MRTWSKLQKEIYDLISPDIKFQIHCVAYPMRSQYGSTDLPRYWITLGKEIIWDYPKDFGLNKIEWTPQNPFVDRYPYQNDVSEISELIREYIDTPRNELFDKEFKNDKWGLTCILKAADRRIGMRRLNELAKQATNNTASIKVIKYRIENNTIPK
jgi:hypothetical protein